MLCSYYSAFGGRLPSGFSLFEGPHAPSVEHLGVISMTVQEGLLQSLSPVPGQPEVIRVFGAWPKEWDASFSLLARGGLLVTATIKNGVIPFIEVESSHGESCQVHNPWGSLCFFVEEGKTKKLQLGEIVRFETKAGARYRLFPSDLPSPIRIAPEERATQASFSFKLANGTVLQESLGRGR